MKMKKNLLFLLLSVMFVSTALGVHVTGMSVHRLTPVQVLKRIKNWVARKTPVTFASDQARAEVMRKILQAGGDPNLLLELAGPGLKGFEWLQEPLKRAKTLDEGGRETLKDAIIAALKKIEAGREIEELEVKFEEKKKEEPEEDFEGEVFEEVLPPPIEDLLVEFKKKKEPKKREGPPEVRDLEREPPTEKEILASDNVFRDVLQKVAVSLSKRPKPVDLGGGVIKPPKENLFEVYLKEIKKDFFKMLRLNKKFLKRAEFDKAFGGRGKEGEFQQLAKKEMQKVVADEGEDAFLDKVYADFTGEQKLLEKFLKVLEPIVFGVEMLTSKVRPDSLRDYITTMLINLAVGLRTLKYTDKEEKAGKVRGADTSDDLANDVVDNFRDTGGRFKDVQNPIEQLAREIDFLRINKGFLRFDMLHGQDALAEAAGIMALQFKPLLFVFRLQEKAPPRTLMARMGAQLFFQKNPEELRKFLEKDKFFTKKLKSFEERQEEAKPTVDTQQFLSEKFAEITDMAGLLKSLKDLSRQKGADKDAIRAIRLAIQKGEKGPEKILQDLKALMGVNIKKSLLHEIELKAILTRGQRMMAFRKPIAKVLEKLGADSADPRKPLRVGKRLYEDLVKIAESILRDLGKKEPEDERERLVYQELKRMAHRLREQTEAVFKSPVRTGFMVYELLLNFFPKKELNSLKHVSQDSIAAWIEPYGLLMGSMAEISTNDRIKKEDKLDNLESVFWERGFQGNTNIAHEKLKTVRDSKILGFKDVYGAQPVKDFVYAAYTMLEERNPKAFRAAMQKIVAEAGLEVEKTALFFKIIQGIADLMLPETFSRLIKRLSALNEGRGTIIDKDGEKELIIPGMKLAGIERGIVKFHKKSFELMKGKFTELLQLLGNDVTAVRKINKKNLLDKISTIFSAVSSDINKIDLTKFNIAKQDQEKKKVIGAVKEFLQHVLNKVHLIKKELKLPRKIEALKIFDELNALNRGLGIVAGGEPVIQALQLDGVSEDKINLHRKIYNSMRGLFSKLGKKIFKKGWFDRGIVRREFDEELQNLFPKIRKRIVPDIKLIEKEQIKLAKEGKKLLEMKKILLKQKRLETPVWYEIEKKFLANKRKRLDIERKKREIPERKRIFKDIKDFLLSLPKKMSAIKKQ